MARYNSKDLIKGYSAYYMCDTRTITGNCLMFWRKDGRGYTYNLDDCEIYTEEKAMVMHRQRETDFPMPVEIVDSMAERHLDHQDFDMYLEKYKTIDKSK